MHGLSGHTLTFTPPPPQKKKRKRKGYHGYLMALSESFLSYGSRPDMIRTIRVLCSGLSVVTSTSGLGEILHEFVVGQTEFLVQ